MTQTDDLARTVYQSLLDAIGDAVRLGDVERYLPFFALPHVVETFAGRTLVDSSDEVRVMFDGILARLNDLDVPELQRSCTIAEFQAPDTIQGMHETRLINRNGLVCESYSGLSQLRLIDGQWKVAVSQYIGAEDATPQLLQRYFFKTPPSTAAE